MGDEQQLDVKMYQDVAFMKAQIMSMNTTVQEIKNQLETKFVPRTEIDQRFNEIKGWVKGALAIGGGLLTVVEILVLWFGTKH